MHWAITGQTAAEIVHGRVDATKPNLGLTNWRGAVVRKQDVATREVRATSAKVHINTQFTSKQQVFLDFVLQHYVSVGVEELDQAKLTPLLRLKYHDSIADAVAGTASPGSRMNPWAKAARRLVRRSQRRRRKR